MELNDKQRNWLNAVRDCATALLEGKDVEYSNGANGWKLKEGPGFYNGNAYRVRPEPKYRPFKPEELPGLLGKPVRVKSKPDDYRLIVLAVGNEVGTVTGVTWNAEDLFTRYEFPDGSPCGVLES